MNFRQTDSQDFIDMVNREDSDNQRAIEVALKSEPFRKLQIIWRKQALREALEIRDIYDKSSWFVKVFWYGGVPEYKGHKVAEAVEIKKQLEEIEKLI